MPRRAGAHRCVTTTLAVEGMHCGGCMRKVEQALTAVAGVVSHAPTCRRGGSPRFTRRAASTASIWSRRSTGSASRPPRSPMTARHRRRRADQALLRRVGVAGFAAANIMLLSVSVWSGAGGDMSPSIQAIFHWLSALIALPVVGYAGRPFFASAAQALRAGRLNMDVPISLGVALATLMSLYQTMRGSEQVYFDAAVALLFFLLVGRFLDQRMRTRAAGAAANLLGLRGSAATVLKPNGGTARLPVRQLVPGMRILTAPGERFPADGRVLRGHRRGRRQSDHRRDRARDRGARRADLCRDRQPDGRARHAGHRHRPAHATRRDRTPDGGCRAGARTLRTPRRPGRALLCTSRAHPRARHLRGLARHRPRLGGGPDGGHRRADHHLPLRAGARRTGGTGGRRQPAVRQGRARQGPRRAGATGRDRHGGVRQDRHADAGRTVAVDRRTHQRRHPRPRGMRWPPPAGIPMPAPWCARPRPPD